MVAGAVGEGVFVELVGETERTGLANVGEAIWAAVGFGCVGGVGFGVWGMSDIHGNAIEETPRRKTAGFEAEMEMVLTEVLETTRGVEGENGATKAIYNQQR
jgi:hypothetical protein